MKTFCRYAQNSDARFDNLHKTPDAENKVDTVHNKQYVS